jgi:MYXO-CTERM domain-containing protein
VVGLVAIFGVAGCPADVGGEDPTAQTSGDLPPLMDLEQLGPKDQDHEPFRGTFANVPVSADHSTKQTEVRSQGKRGTCLAMAATAAIESYYGLSEHLSVEQMWERMGKKGYLSKSQYSGTRLGKDSLWPYNGAKRPEIKQSSLWGVNKVISTGSDESSMKKYLSDHPRNNILLCMRWWHSKVKSGVFYDPQLKHFWDKWGITKNIKCKKPDCGGHCVLVVGYERRQDADGSMRTFFKFKNSWGKSWGNSGYGFASSRYIKEYAHKTYMITSAPPAPSTPTPPPGGCHQGKLFALGHCTPGCPCDQGQGDCNSDADCKTGLTCAHNVGANYGAASYIDVCEAGPTPPPAGCHQGNLFALGYCTPGCPCDQGQGDCNSDADCKTGLTCAKDVGAKYGAASYIDVCEAGSTPPPPPSSLKPFGGACSGNTDCQEQLCVNGDSGMFCSRSCSANADCPTGYDCSSSVCQQQKSAPTPPTPQTPPGQGGGFGALCAANQDCGSGMCTIVGAVAFCSSTCGVDADCPLGSVCQTTSLQAPVCVPTGDQNGADVGVVGGCSVGSGAGSASPLLLVGFFFLLGRRRRR